MPRMTHVFAEQSIVCDTLLQPTTKVDALRMPFAILRTGKLTSLGHLRAAGGHNDRSIPATHAKAGQDTKPSAGFGPLTAADVVAGVVARIPAKRRKDAVVAIEQVLTASPEFFELGATGWNKTRLRTWANTALQWLKQTHGKNLVSAVLHLDETSPHIHAIITPLTPDGRLCAKEYTARARLVAFQDGYAQAMSVLGLQRGVRGSKAEHREVKEFYRAIKAPLPPASKPPVPPELGPIERITAEGKAKQAAYETALKAHRERVAARNKQIADQARFARTAFDAAARARDAAEALEDARQGQLAAARAKDAAERATKVAQQEMETLEKATIVACAKLINGMPRDQLAKALGVELRPGGDVVDQLRRRGLVKDLREGVAYVSERMGGANLVKLAQWANDYSEEDRAPAPRPRMG